MVVEVPASTLHRRIHAELSGIPIIRQSSAKSVLDEFGRLERAGVLKPDAPLSKRIELLIFMLECVEPATVKALKKQLAVVTDYEMREVYRKLP